MKSTILGIIELAKQYWLDVNLRIRRRNVEKQAISWIAANGDATLRLDYDLSESSVVFDLGGYRGQWANDIFSRFNCVVHVFEPVPEFAESIRNRFANNPRIFVHEMGLASEYKTIHLSIDADSSSSFRRSNSQEVSVQLVPATSFLHKLGATSIDLMKINIEGGEYELLEHLIDTGWIAHIKNIQIQFHDLVPKANHRMKQIQMALETTHSLTYQYCFVWENWRLRE